MLACVAWRFLSNLRAIGKRESRDKERQSCEEPGRETTKKLPAQIAGIFLLVQYAGVRAIAIGSEGLHVN